MVSMGFRDKLLQSEDLGLSLGPHLLLWDLAQVI
jgi:hypothetical protein